LTISPYARLWGKHIEVFTFPNIARTTRRANLLPNFRWVTLLPNFRRVRLLPNFRRVRLLPNRAQWAAVAAFVQVTQISR